MLTPTVGHVGMIAQEIMIETHVIIKQQDIKMQQQELIQWEAPQKIKNTQNENDVVGSYITSISYNATILVAPPISPALPT